MNAEAVGTANEGEHLPKLVADTLGNLEEAGVKLSKDKSPIFMGDANYFSEENLKACEELGVEPIIPDGRCGKPKGKKSFGNNDFIHHEEGDYYECPNGKKLKFIKKRVFLKREVKMYKASIKDCRNCPFNSSCISSKKDIAEQSRGRQILISENNDSKNIYCNKMRQKLTTEKYQDIYAYRIQIVEPVFANIGNCMELKRFTLRGKRKVNGQWILYSIVHNLGKCLNEYNKLKGYEKVNLKKKKLG